MNMKKITLLVSVLFLGCISAYGMTMEKYNTPQYVVSNEELSSDDWKSRLIRGSSCIYFAKDITGSKEYDSPDLSVRMTDEGIRIEYQGKVTVTKDYTLEANW